MKKGLAVMTILALVAVLAAGCTELAPVTPAPTQPSGPALSTGTIEVRVTDAPGDVEAILVTVSEVTVHKASTDEEDGVWITLGIVEDTFNLLELEELELTLATEVVAAGKYTQLRMTVFEVWVTLEGEDPVEATVPSSELKFVRPFDLEAGGTIALVVDFDAAKSVVVTGADKIIFKPVVKLAIQQGGKGKPIKLESSLETSGDATAEQSDEQAYSGEESVYLETTGNEGSGDEARIVIPLPEGTTLGDIDSISWWEYLEDGYPPHVDIMLDFDSDDVVDDSLVFEYAYNSEDHYADAPMPYGAVLDDWYQTFSDDSEGPAQVDDDANGWLASGPPGPPGDSNFIYGTLAEWKAGTVDASVDSNTVVLALEIEVDNWVVQSEAYVDDIEIVIGGVTYTVGL